MRSRTCAPDSRPVPGLYLVVLTMMLAACGEKAAEPRAPDDFGLEVQELGARLFVILDQRKIIRETPFFANSAVTEEMATMSIRIDACTTALQRLAQYDIDADGQNVPDQERFKFKAQELKALNEHFSHYESVLGRYDELRLRDAEVFFDNYGKVLRGNQILQVLIDNDVPTYAEQNLMRDLSQRVLDSRRYWCQELANVLRGLDPDSDLLSLAVGQTRNIVTELKPVHERLNLAYSDFSRLVNGRDGIAGRMKWSRETLERLPNDEPFRSSASAILDAMEPEIRALESKVATEFTTLFDQSHVANERRDALVRSQTALLERLNRAVLIEAQKRGWPLPR